MSIEPNPRRRDLCRCGAYKDQRAEQCQECYWSGRLPCPSISHYNKGCKCQPCKDLAAAKRKEYRDRAKQKAAGGGA